MLGQFTGARPFEYDNGYDMQAMIDQVRAVIGIPVVTGLQFGHVPDLLTLPFGALARNWSRMRTVSGSLCRTIRTSVEPGAVGRRRGSSFPPFSS